MIDFHAHVLPAIDDGATDVAQSLEMLRLLKNDGVNTVVCSSHFYFHNRTVEQFLQKREEGLNALKQCDMTLIPAAEVELGEFSFDFSSLNRLAVGDTSYILLELPYASVWGEKLFANIRMLMQASGLRPIIAHVERYPAISRKPENVTRLLSLGCYLQANGESLLRVKRHSVLDVLMRHGQIHVLGTDCHDLERRPPRYGETIKAVTARYGEDCANYLQRNMKHILENRDIGSPYKRPVRKLFSFFW